jgi:hypothetical protein
MSAPAGAPPTPAAVAGPRVGRPQFQYPNARRATPEEQQQIAQGKGALPAHGVNRYGVDGSGRAVDDRNGDGMPDNKEPGYGDVLDRWYNPWTTQQTTERGEESLKGWGQTAMGIGAGAAATAAAVPVAAAAGLTAGAGGAMTAGGTAATLGTEVGLPVALEGARQMAGGTEPTAQNTPAAVKPAAMDLKAQDALVAGIKDLPPEQQRAKVQEGVQAHVASLPPEEQKGVQDVATGNVDTPEAKQFNEKVEGPVKDQYVKDEYAKQTANNPNTTPQQAGGILNGIMEGWNNMPNEMKWMMGIGLGGGLLGMLGGMFGGGGGMGMLGLLGLGAAGLAGAAGGMFGQGAQDALGGMVGQLGQATGMIPKDMDLSALKGNDAVQRATSQSSGGGILGGIKAYFNPKGEAEKVKGQLGQADQLNRLMMVPEGMRPALLRQISPNSSPEEIQQMLNNANQMHSAMNDSNHQLGQNVQRGRQFVQDPSAYVNNAASEYYNPTKWDVMPWNWGGKTSADYGYELANSWVKAADEKATQEWMRKFRARGQGGRWVNTRRGSKTEKRVTSRLQPAH